MGASYKEEEIMTIEIKKNNDIAGHQNKKYQLGYNYNNLCFGGKGFWCVRDIKTGDEWLGTFEKEQLVKLLSYGFHIIIRELTNESYKLI